MQGAGPWKGAEPGYRRRSGVAASWEGWGRTTAGGVAWVPEEEGRNRLIQDWVQQGGSQERAEPGYQRKILVRVTEVWVPWGWVNVGQGWISVPRTSARYPRIMVHGILCRTTHPPQLWYQEGSLCLPP